VPKRAKAVQTAKDTTLIYEKKNIAWWINIPKFITAGTGGGYPHPK
jgi:hypothetical protein